MSDYAQIIENLFEALGPDLDGGEEEYDEEDEEFDEMTQAEMDHAAYLEKMIAVTLPAAACPSRGRMKCAQQTAADMHKCCVHMSCNDLTCCL